MPKHHLCIVARTAYAALARRADLPNFGGAQIQQVLIARELVRRGHRVSFVVLDHGQPDGIEHDGIRAFKTCGPDDGLPVVRFLHPRWTSLASAMKRSGATVFYQRGAGAETGQAALWCGAKGRPFVFAAASDSDCDASLPYLRTRQDRVLYRVGLRRASRVVVQTPFQHEQMRAAFGIDSTLIRSCSEDPGEPVWPRPRNERPRVLWVGRFSYEKRPELLLDVARACPACQFDVVGAATKAAGGDALMSRAASLPNVTLHGRVGHDAMDGFYRQADVLLCTSAWEGFPNTFMEAWSRGTPVVSTVDPAGSVSQGGTGLLAADAGGLARAVESLTRDPREWDTYSRRARAYFVANHGIGAVVDAYERLLDEVTLGPEGSRNASTC